MRAAFGVNVPPGGTEYPVGGAGPWHRLVLSGPVPQTIRACVAYHRLGRRVLGVITRQVTQELGGGSSYEIARRALDLFGGSIDALQVWNEPDGGGEASDVASHAIYNDWLRAFRDACRHVGWRKPLVAAGLVSGDPAFLRGVDMEGYLLALHPYDQRPFHGYPDWGWGDLPSLLDAYRPWLPPGTAYWLTECSRTTTDAATQAKYAAALVTSVATRGDVAVCLWYCWKDWRMPGSGDLQPFGLVREDGSAKLTLAAWVEAIQMAEHAPTWQEDKQRIEEQISLLVENQRRILMGKWDEARIYLDAVDPEMAGKWTNCPVNGCNDLGG